MSVVLGPLTHLHTRFCHQDILRGLSWDGKTRISQRALDELLFWRDNLNIN